MPSKIFYCFLIVMVAAVLWLLPVTPGIYSFRTDVKEDEFYITTGGGVITGNVTLNKALYDDDVSTISFSSNCTTDNPQVVEYHTTNRVLDVTGLTESEVRVLTVNYDFDALSSSDAISNFMDKLSWIWLLVIAIFPVAGIVAIFVFKKD